MAKRSKAQKAAAARRGWSTRRNNQLLEDLEDALGEEFESLEQALESLEEETKPDKDQERDDIWHWIETNPKRSQGLESLFERHFGDKEYEFLLEEGILKISIGTTKTRKRFSVRK